MKNTNITDSAINNINRKLIYKFTLDGKELPLSDVMNNPTITYDCGLDQYSVGNLYIGELSFSVKNKTFVNYKSEIVVTVDIQTDSGTISTKLGKFYVDTVVEQGVTKQIKAYDGMFLLNVGYFPSARHTTTKAIVDDIASKHNLTILGFENRTANINNEQIDGKTVLEMLQLVAGVHGGSIFMNGDGAVKFVQATDTGKTYTKSQYSTPTLDTSVSYNITKLKVIYGEKTTNEDGSVKDEGYFEVGEGLDSRTLAISNVLLKGQRTQAQNILNTIKNMNGYNRFDTTILLGDYRLEPMDVISYVKDDKTYKVPIIYMQIALTYSGLSIRTQSPTLAESKSEFSFKGTITQKIDNVYTEMMQVKDIVANSITVGDLEAVNAEIENLKAKDATITNLVASKANITDLNATNAEIDNLQADVAQVGTLVANKADISSLSAIWADIDNLQANVAGIDQLLAGNITGGNIQSGSITSDKLTIDDGFIKDAMIDTVSASKILAGKISTGSVSIQSDDGKMLIADETIQISDGKQVRVQIGETANGDYAIVIYDANGNVMFDATGITEHAIKDSIIKDDMVADDANINGKKIDITSLVTAINEDGSSTINVSKLYYDSKGQSFEVVFNEMTTKQNELEDETDALMTELNVQKGQISTLVQNSTITNSDGTTTSIRDAFSEFQQTQEEINLRVEQNISNIEASDVGATNLLRFTDLPSFPFGDKAIGSDWSNAYYEENTGMTRTLYEVTDCLPKSINGLRIVDTTGNKHSLGMGQNKVLLIDGETYTMSAYFKVYDVNTQAVLGYYSDGKYTTVIKPLTESYEWERISTTFTFKATSDNNTSNILFGLNGTGFSGIVCGMKLEKGSMATDWSPSPYDVSDAIDSFEQRIESAELKVSSEAITATVESSTVVKTMQNNISSLDSRMNSAELKLTEDALVSTVTNSSSFNNAVADSLDANSYIRRNLVKQSRTLSEAIAGVQYVNDTDIKAKNVEYSKDSNYARMTISDAIDEKAQCPLYVKKDDLIELGATSLTVSFEYPSFVDDYFYASSLKDATYLSLGIYKINSINDGNSLAHTSLSDCIHYYSEVEVTDDFYEDYGVNEVTWKRVSYTFNNCVQEVPNGYEYRLSFYGGRPTFSSSNYKEQFCFIRFPKVEIGTEASEWSYAPEDVDEHASVLNQRMSKLEQTADSLTLSVSRVESGVNAFNLLRYSDLKVVDSLDTMGKYFWKTQQAGINSVGGMVSESITSYSPSPIDRDGLKAYRVEVDSSADVGCKYGLQYTQYETDDGSTTLFKVGETYTMSAYFLLETGSATVGFCFGSLLTENTSVPSNYYTIENVGQWYRFSQTLVCDNNTLLPSFVFKGNSFTGYICGMQMTVGDMLVDWHPAPADENEVLASLENQVVINTENISSLQVNADSISASVQEVVTSIDTINGDITNLTNKVNATMSAEDIQFLISSEINNTSVGKVTTETGYVFDKDGLMISKSNSEMKTQITEDGMTVYKNNNAVLVANNEGVDAVNLHATTYLIVGDNSRFENYGSDRTGCFFIKKGSD